MPFQKRHHPKTEFKKGHPPTKGCFKKGHIPWSKLHPELMPRGEKNGRWKGGRKRTITGYIFIYQPNHPFCNNQRCVFEHRLIVEQQICRYLKPSEKCHHLGAKDDNRPHMLMVFKNNGIHRQFEGGKKIKPKDIIFDGRKLHT